jgi:hypothetical protein
MSIDEQEPRLAMPLVELLARVRKLIREYVAIDGAARTLIAACAAFWSLLAIDWTFEPSLEVRLLLLLLAIGAVTVVAFRWFVARLVAPLSNRSMALVLERTFSFDESLLTAVEMTERPVELDSYGRDMLAHTCDSAEQRAVGLDLRRLFNFRPLRLAVAVASASLLAICVFAFAWPDTFRFGVARIATKTDECWPRSTRLVVEGFEDGEAVVARGGELKLVVKADASMAVPDKVQVRYQSADGTSQRKYMVRVGVAKAGQDDYQSFEYLFQNLLSPVKFEIRGGDARLEDLRIRVVESPTIAISIGCEYPAYTQLAHRELPATAVTPLPQGSRVTLHAVANKDLVAAEIEQFSPDGTSNVHRVDTPSRNPKAFDFVLSSLDADTTLRFTLFDTDGVRNRETIQLTLVSVVDAPPAVEVQLTGIGSAITPNARLPLIGPVRDDYGVDKAWIAYTIDDGKPAQFTLPSPPRSSVELPVDTAFEVSNLELKPEQKLLVGVEAFDNRKLPPTGETKNGDPKSGEPNLGQGQRWLLDIVTPEQLRASLESRELNVRQRFESIIAELVESRDALKRLEAIGANPNDADFAAKLEQSRLHVVRARQNSEKDGQETRGVATAFDAIYQELANNRIDTEELKIRLKHQIAEPLFRVCDGRFPVLTQRVRDLDAGLAGPQAASLQKAAVAEADAVVVELQRVRDKMLELETFNEAIDLLRAILAAEKEVGEGIKKQRSDKVRKLLEE